MWTPAIVFKPTYVAQIVALIIFLLGSAGDAH